MSTNKNLLLLILIFSLSNCILYSEEDFKEIDFMTPTKFAININEKAYFKYKLQEQKESIGLKFLHANLYTVNVKVYSSFQENQQLLNYSMAQNQFKEINVTNCNEYVYIVIEETNTYYHYDDYLTIYDSEKQIKLENNKVISINNFLSNNKYELFYPISNKSIVLFYNTQNFEKNKRIISIEYEGDKIIDNYEEPTLKTYFNYTGNESLIINIENFIEVDTEGNNDNQEFSIIIYEVDQPKINFNQIIQNQIDIINYIYNNESQIYYFYTDISDFNTSNTFNFKLNFQYFNTTNVKVLTKIVELDNEITQEDLEDNIPQTNTLPSDYDSESDEFFRIYFNKQSSGKKYTYLLVSIDIEDENYYYGNKVLEVSIGEQVQIKDFSNVELNALQKIEMKTKNYIPYYSKLKLDPSKKYLLAFENQVSFISTFIKGDIITADNTINTDYLTTSNQIMVLSDIEEFTIRLFGPERDVFFTIEKIDGSNFEYQGDERNNNKIFELNMKKNEVKYILGAYTFEQYAYGAFKVNYYATIDSGDFDLFYKNSTSIEETSLFPYEQKYLQKFNEIFVLQTDLDLFKVVCKSDGVMSIRPQYKTYNVTTHLLEENIDTKITMAGFSEVIQFSAPITKIQNNLYFSILLVNSESSIKYLKDNEITLEIAPDIEGAFKKGTINLGQTFAASFNLGIYKSDELAIHLNSNAFNNEIEIVNIIHDKYTSYKLLKKGENKNIELNNVAFPISSENKTLYINIENLKDKKISYVIMQSSVNDSNYVFTADKYQNSTEKELKQSKEKIILNNTYYNQKDEIRPFTFFLLSVMNQDAGLDYNIKIDFEDSKDVNPSDDNNDDDDTTKIIIIVVIIIAVILILLGIILFNYVLKKKRNSSGIEKLSTEPSDNIVPSKFTE